MKSFCRKGFVNSLGQYDRSHFFTEGFMTATLLMSFPFPVWVSTPALWKKRKRADFHLQLRRLKPEQSTLASCHESKESWKVKSEVWSLCQVFSDPGDIRPAGYYRWSPKEAKPCPRVPWVGVFFQSYPRRNSGLWKLGVDAVSSPRHWVSFWKSPTPAKRASSHVYFQRHRWFLSLTPTHPTP